jgi:hypothetical protein
MSASAHRKPLVFGLATLVLVMIGAGSVFLGPLSAQGCGYGYGGYGCGGEPAYIELSPASATGPVGTQKCVVATVRDALDAPVENVSVRFSVNGTPTGALQTTGADGNTTFCYSGPSSPRTDTITATIETGTGPYIQNPPSCSGAGLSYSFAFRYANGESTSLAPVVGCDGSPGADTKTTATGQKQDAGVAQTSVSGSTVVNITTNLTHPSDPGTNVSQTTGLDIGLPSGMTRAFANFPTCQKATLEQYGPAGCPQGSRIGTGTGTMDARPVVTDPIQALISIFNGDNGHLLLYVFPDLGPTSVAEGVPNASGVLVFTIPPLHTLPSAPDASITQLNLSLGATGSGGGLSDSATVTWVATASGGSGNPGVTSVPSAAVKAILSGPTTQKFTGSIAVGVQCPQACTALGSASVSVPKTSKVLKSKRVKRTLAAGQRAKLKLKFAKKPARAIRRALRHRRLTATVSVTTRVKGSNTSSISTAKRKVKLRK